MSLLKTILIALFFIFLFSCKQHEHYKKKVSNGRDSLVLIKKTASKRNEVLGDTLVACNISFEEKKEFKKGEIITFSVELHNLSSERISYTTPLISDYWNPKKNYETTYFKIIDYNTGEVVNDYQKHTFAHGLGKSIGEIHVETILPMHTLTIKSYPLTFSIKKAGDYRLYFFFKTTKNVLKSNELKIHIE
jgi:hypothetical protein